VWDNVTAADVAAGQFGANTGGGDYSFPGKVGFGTPTPSQKCHIVDNVSANIPSLLIQNNGARASLRLYGKSSLDGDLSSANVQFFDQDTTNSAHLVFESAKTGIPLVVWINGNKKLGVYAVTASTGGLSIGSYSGIVPPPDGMIIPGNVGFGTPTPSQKCHIVDNVSVNIPSLLIQNNGARASLRLYGKSSLDIGQASANVQFFDQDTTNSAHIVFESGLTNAPLVIWINGSKRLGIYGASTSGMSVGSYAGIVPPSDGMIIPGRVGIGTTAPTAKLHVAGATGYNQLRLQTPYTPTSSNDPNGNLGDICWDDNYIYVKTSTGWKRAPLSAF
jgi:hypothetical protein